MQVCFLRLNTLGNLKMCFWSTDLQQFTLHQMCTRYWQPLHQFIDDMLYIWYTWLPLLIVDVPWNAWDCISNQHCKILSSIRVCCFEWQFHLDNSTLEPFRIITFQLSHVEIECLSYQATLTQIKIKFSSHHIEGQVTS